ncbi:flavin reductase family protein [Haematobacter genomosp. 1]|uniref:flavin reductase family protein n=1 Tax=Haematobacter genomosp. 1 TaxID=366618 RepID=UPI001C5305F7|nr:flavin reductase family protein [Haematobacter genomosp. 1]
MTVSRTDFRQAMSQLAASVNVVTTDGAAGRWGMTASAVCSVSDTPASLLVCINRSTRLHQLAQENRVLAINVLTSGQEAISGLFAGGDPEARFASGRWSTLTTGAPVLLDALVGFDCRVQEIVDGGSHGIFIAEVVALHQGSAEGGLVYFNRSYRQLGQAA